MCSFRTRTPRMMVTIDSRYVTCPAAVHPLRVMLASLALPTLEDINRGKGRAHAADAPSRALRSCHGSHDWLHRRARILLLSADPGQG
jgi:hypothetical protein